MLWLSEEYLKNFLMDDNKMNRLKDPTAFEGPDGLPAVFKEMSAKGREDAVKKKMIESAAKAFGVNLDAGGYINKKLLEKLAAKLESKKKEEHKGLIDLLTVKMDQISTEPNERTRLWVESPEFPVHRNNTYAVEWTFSLN